MYNVIHASFYSVQSANDSFDLRFEMKGAVRERLGVLKCQCLKCFSKVTDGHQSEAYMSQVTLETWYES